MIKNIVFHDAGWIAAVLCLNATQHFWGKKAADTLPVDGIFRGDYALGELVKIVFLNPYLLLTGISLGVGFVLWMRLLVRIPVSVAVPILSLNYVVLAVLGYFFLGESLSGFKILGILLIVIGVFFVVRS